MFGADDTAEPRTGFEQQHFKGFVALIAGFDQAMRRRKSANASTNDYNSSHDAQNTLVQMADLSGPFRFSKAGGKPTFLPARLPSRNFDSPVLESDSTLF